MAMIIDRRHAGLAGLVLLLVVAAAIPVCLLAASPAMASSMDQSHGGCGSSEEHPNVCPHQDEMQSPAVLTHDAPTFEDFHASAAAPLADPPVQTRSAALQAEPVHAALIEHLTPLLI